MPIDPQELTRITLLAGLADDERAWIAERCEPATLGAGDTLFHAGERADWMCLVLDGVVEAQRESVAAGAPTFTFRTGDVFGVVPFSRMVNYQGTGRALVPTRVAMFPRAGFDAMLARIPALGPRFAGFLADRVRDATRRDQQFEKLTALGRLSAGLAHELNNPAAAARRSAAEARRRADDAAHHAAEMAAQLAESTASEEVCETWCAALERVRASARARPRDFTEDALDRADREQAIGEWLQRAGVESAWALAPTFADAGVGVDDLDEITAPMPVEARASAVAWCEAALATDALLATVENATARIVELVAAVKTYTHMDRGMAPSAVDVREGIESTLALFTHKLRDRKIVVARELAGDVPPVRGYAGELNQVWMNLVDNAIDAAPAGAGTITVRARRDGEGGVLVEVQDDGPGIPDTVRDRIWEPFFTTKGVGRGTGLGLDIARHIVVDQHGGRIDLATAPGRTVFSVRLPASNDGVSVQRGAFDVQGTTSADESGAPPSRGAPLAAPPRP